MPEQKATAEVRVSKRGLAGPHAEVLVSSNISAAGLAGILQKVVTNERVLTAAGLRACGGCKSGLDISIIDQFQEVIKVEA